MPLVPHCRGCAWLVRLLHFPSAMTTIPSALLLILLLFYFSSIPHQLCCYQAHTYTSHTYFHDLIAQGNGPSGPHTLSPWCHIFDVDILTFCEWRWWVFFFILLIFVLLSFLHGPHILLLSLQVSFLGFVRLWKMLINDSNSKTWPPNKIVCFDGFDPCGFCWGAGSCVQITDCLHGGRQFLCFVNCLHWSWAFYNNHVCVEICDLGY